MRASGRAVGLSVCLLLLSLAASPAHASPLRLTGRTMGTTYAVQLTRAPDRIQPELLQKNIERILTSIDRQMSTYRPDSEISRFNAGTTTDWVAVSPEIGRVVAEALRTSRLSGGAFDITAAPLIDLWGFGAGEPSRRRPTEAMIWTASAGVGYAGIEVREVPPALRRHRSGLAVDLSGIAKGFAVDEISAHLDGVGVADYLVEIGGELRGRGRNARGKPWAVAVEQPSEARAAAAVIRLDRAAIATSGDYRNYFDQDGVRYSHIIDPRTGAPIHHRLTSVAVVDPSAMRADALATALLVLGPEGGPRLARREHLAALFLVRQGAGLQVLQTAEFERLVVH